MLLYAFWFTKSWKTFTLPAANFPKFPEIYTQPNGGWAGQALKVRETAPRSAMCCMSGYFDLKLLSELKHSHVISLSISRNFYLFASHPPPNSCHLLHKFWLIHSTLILTNTIKRVRVVHIQLSVVGINLMLFHWCWQARVQTSSLCW